MHVVYLHMCRPNVALFSTLMMVVLFCVGLMYLSIVLSVLNISH